MSARERAVIPSEKDGIRLTEFAANKVKSIAKEQGMGDSVYLFVGVAGGGCSGLKWVLDLRDETSVPVSDQDEVFVSNDVLVVCELKSYMVGNLAGTEIDYTDSLMGGGFVCNNPNSTHKCGCGKSYSA